MTHLLVLGRTGQLGRALQAAALPPRWRRTVLGRADADFADPDALKRAVARVGPDLVVNAAAYTDVDRAETEPAAAWQVNAIAPGILAAETARIGAAIVHVSTDYVFDGDRAGLWAEDDPIGPVNVYGASKAAGELAVAASNPRHLILRTSWLFSPHGTNFVTTMLRLGRGRERLTVVDDQVGRPTRAGDLAHGLFAAAALALRDETAWGTYHFANGGAPVSRYGFARAIFAGAPWNGPAPELAPVSTGQYPAPARRPANTALATGKFTDRFGCVPRPWEEAVGEVLDQLQATAASKRRHIPALGDPA